MTIAIDIREAKTHLSKWLNHVMLGEEIIIEKSGIPVAKIVPITSKVNTRRPGSAMDKVLMADDFDAPLSEELLDES